VKDAKRSGRPKPITEAIEQKVLASVREDSSGREKARVIRSTSRATLFFASLGGIVLPASKLLANPFLRQIEGKLAYALHVPMLTGH
jgi:hypothetical protein